MIKLLTPDAFRGQLRAPKKTGISPIFRAKIQVEDESIRCFVKPVPDQIRCPVTGREVPNREAAAEALGYVLAKAVGLRVPDVAGIILLAADQLPPALLPKLERIANGKRQSDYICWFSQDMVYPSLRQHHIDSTQPKPLIQRQLGHLAQQLASHPATSSIVAFDDWLLNSDRNPGNLLQGPGILLLIDHGRIFAYPNWLPGGVGSMPWPLENILQQLIDAHVPHWSERLPNKSARALAYNTFSVKFKEGGETAARAVLSEFFTKADIDAIVRLLTDRLNSERYAKAAGLIL